MPTQPMQAIKQMNGWAKALIAMLIPLLAAAVAFGVVQSDARHNHNQIMQLEESKAEAAVVELMQQQLNRMENKIDRLLEGNP